MMNATSNPNLILCFHTFFFPFRQWTPLHVAVEVGYTDIVKYLVDKEADINIRENGGVSV